MDAEWEIGPFRFVWFQGPMTLTCILNGRVYDTWQLRHCDNERLAREYSANMVNELCFGWVREVVTFKKTLGPEPRDRHL